MKACERAAFPICLNESLLWMFGKNGKRRLDAMVTKDMVENSPREIWKLYEKYLEHAGNIVGEDIGKMVEFESVKAMERKCCTKCPLFVKHSK